MADLKVSLPLKKGVVIFSMFAADRYFGTYSLRSNYPRTIQMPSPFLNAYNSKLGPRLHGRRKVILSMGAGQLDLWSRVSHSMIITLLPSCFNDDIKIKKLFMRV